LHGKIGAATIPFKVVKYTDNNELFVEVRDVEAAEKFWQALVLTSSSLDGSRALRFRLE